jgi:hypothetical protein
LPGARHSLFSPLPGQARYRPKTRAPVLAYSGASATFRWLKAVDPESLVLSPSPPCRSHRQPSGRRPLGSPASGSGRSLLFPVAPLPFFNYYSLLFHSTHLCPVSWFSSKRRKKPNGVAWRHHRSGHAVGKVSVWIDPLMPRLWGFGLWFQSCYRLIGN